MQEKTRLSFQDVDKVETKRITRNMVVLTIRMLLQIGVYLFSLRVLLEQLGITDYGIYDLISGFVLTLSFLNNALQTSTLRFITYAIGKEDVDYQNRNIGASFTLHLVLAIIVLLLGESVGLYYISEQIQVEAIRQTATLSVYQCALFGGVLLVGTMPLHLLMLAHERITAYASITIVDMVLKLLCAYSLQFFTTDRLMAYAFLILGEVFLIRLIYAIYCKRSIPTLQLNLFRKDILLSKMLHFTGWSTLGNLAFVLNTQGINLLLNFLGGNILGPIYNASRGVAFQVQTAVNSCCGSLLTSVNPQITKSYAKGNFNKMNFFLQLASRSAFFLALLMSVPLLIETEQLFALWLVKVPPYAISFTRLLLIVALVDSLSTPLAVATEATGKIRRYNWMLSIPMLSTLPLAYWLTQQTEQIASVFLTLLATSLCTQALRIYLTHRLLKFSLWDYVQRVLLRMFAVSIFALTLPLLLHLYLPHHLGYSLLNIGVSILWTSIVIFIVGLFEHERHALLYYVRKKFF